MYLLPNVKNNNFKKKRQGSEKIQTMDSSMERNFWTVAWNHSRIWQCVVESKDTEKKKPSNEPDGEQEVNVVYRS